MPTVCVVVGCHNTYVDKETTRRFYRIPAVKKNQGPLTQQLSERRRREWLAAINRQGLTNDTVRKHHLVCDAHFVKGKPAYLHLDTDIDWVPTLNLAGHNERQNANKRKRHDRALIIAEKRKRIDAASSLLELHHSVTLPEDCLSIKAEETDEVDSIAGNGKEAIEMSKEEMAMTINSMTVDLTNLKAKLSKMIFDEEKFKDNDADVKYYTGLQCWYILHQLMNFLMPSMRTSFNNVLSPFQEILLVLLKLRFNFGNKLLGDIFGIHKSSVSRIFLKVLNTLYINLQWLIHWPDKECITATMPLCFVRNFGRKVRVIIDCFEIFIERPANLKARAKTYSNYKHTNTVKFLIGITPQGTVSFLSDGWGGRASDKRIVENSSFLGKLEPGDLVLADRGFDIAESIGIMGANLQIPAFTRGKKQLKAHEIESTRRIANVRIHVERVIGNIQNKYTILNSEIPMEYLNCLEGEQVTTLDKIVHVCACLINLNPTVVPFS